MERKIINYIVVCINEFALSKNLTEQEAFRYLYANKGIEFLTETTILSIHSPYRTALTI